MNFRNGTSPSVNHNLLAMGLKQQSEWLIQMGRFAFSEWCKTGLFKRTAVEIVKGKIVRDVVKQGVLNGYTAIYEYDLKQGRIEITAHAWGGSGSYLLTPAGFFLHGDENTPVTDAFRVQKCLTMRSIVVRHCPELGNKLFKPGGKVIAFRPS